MLVIRGVKAGYCLFALLGRSRLPSSPHLVEVVSWKGFQITTKRTRSNPRWLGHFICGCASYGIVPLGKLPGPTQPQSMGDRRTSTPVCWRPQTTPRVMGKFGPTMTILETSLHLTTYSDHKSLQRTAAIGMINDYR